MDEQQLENLAREYAEEATKPQKSDPDMSCSDLNEMKRDVAEYAKEIIHWLSKRFYLVDKKRVEELDLAFRAKQYDMVILNSEDFAYLFPQIAKETEETTM